MRYGCRGGGGQDEPQSNEAFPLVRALLTVTAVLVALSLMQAGAAQPASWVTTDVDRVLAYSGDGKAKVTGHVKWYHGSFPRGDLHRGDYSKGAVVYAAKRVPCIWAKVPYGYPAGSFTVGPGGPGGGVSGGSYRHGSYVSCRKRGYRKPRRLKLYGVGYAKSHLNSTTVTVCTSRSKRQGARFCSNEKVYYQQDGLQ